MLWALLLTVGGLLVGGPVGAIIGLLIGILLALVIGRRSGAPAEGQVKDPAAVTARSVGWLVVAGIVVFAFLDADKRTSANPPSDDVAQTVVEAADVEASAPVEAAVASVGPEPPPGYATGPAIDDSDVAEIAMVDTSPVDPQPRSQVTTEDVGRLLEYGSLIGEGARCGEDVSGYASKVEAWLDRINPATRDLEVGHRAMFRGLSRQPANGREGREINCDEVRLRLASTRWP